MNVFKQINLKNYGPFADTSFDIPAGLAVVYGLNRSGGNYSSNGNAAGKSFLMGSLSEILFESPVVGEKQDAVKAGTRSLEIDINGKNTVIRRINSKIEIKVDNKLKKFRTATIARQYLKDNIPFTENEFSTYIYLDSRVPHPLVMGNSTERKNFFTSFFGLDKIDAQRKLVQAEMAELLRNKAAYDELYAEYKKSTLDLLNKETRNALKEKLAKGEQLLVSLQAENLKSQEVSRLLTFGNANHDLIKKLSVALQNEWSIDAYDDCLIRTKAYFKSNSEDLEAGIIYNQYQQDVLAYDTAVEELPTHAYKLMGNIKKAEVGSNRYIENSQVEKTLSRELKTINLVRPVKVEKPDSDKVDLEILKKTYTNHLIHASKFEEGKCETCGQLVAIKNPRVVKSKLLVITKSLDSWKLYDNYLTEFKIYKQDKLRVADLKTKLELVKADVIKYKPYANSFKLLNALPEEPEPFTGTVKDLAITKRMLAEDTERLQMLAFARPHLETVFAIIEITAEQEEEIKTSEVKQGRINRIQDAVSGIRAKLALQSVLLKKAKATKVRLLELKELVKDEDALKVVLKSCGDRGVKRVAINSISSVLIKTINQYARTVFPEDYQFEFNWETSQLSLLVHRKYGDKILTSDVRKLSGAESKLFTIILVLALLTFVPDSKRSNILVLDEPTANMSEETTLAFQSLLPVLLKVIPSIIVITPKTNERYENAHNFTVVKDKGVSKVHNGHPSTIKTKKENLIDRC